MKKLYLIAAVAVAVVVLVAGFMLVRAWNSSPEVERYTITPARISEIKSMVELSTVEIYEDVPLKAHVGKRHLVGSMTLEGSVGFDLEQLSVEERGDTIIVRLPKEKVTLRESTADGAYRVIDTWNDDPFGKSGFTAAEENEMKRKVLASAERNIYRKGYVADARRQARQSVTRLLETASGRPVVAE